MALSNTKSASHSRILHTHQDTQTDRPMTGCEGPTEKLSSFVDKLLQPIAQQKSYLKNTTNFVNFIEKTRVPADNACFNGHNEPLYKYTTRGGNSNSMRSIRDILQQRTSYSCRITRAGAKAYPTRKLIPIYRKKTTRKQTVWQWARKCRLPLLTSS